MSETKTCAICQQSFSGFGHNPSPFSGERCCDSCNEKFVIPLRIYEITKNENSAILFKTDGTVETIKPKGQYFTLSELQGLVGGLIELYPRRVLGHFVVCNEEGLILNLRPNQIFFAYSEIPLVGNVLLCPEKIFEEPEEEDDEWVTASA